MIDIQNLAIMATDKCNLNCYHCFRPQSDNTGFIDPKKILSLASKLSSTSLRRVRFTGGEPFLHRDLIGMIEAFSSVRMYTSVVSNATTLCNKKLKELKSSGLKALWCSVHSVNPICNDTLAGKNGAHASLESTLINAIELGIETNVYFPVSKKNCMDVAQTLAWLKKLGINQVKVLKLTPVGRAAQSNGFDHFTQNEWNSFWNNFNAFEFLDSISIQGITERAMPISPKSTCTILPLKHLNMDTRGDIYPCCLLNGRDSFKVGKIDDLLTLDFDEAVSLFYQRAKDIFSTYKDNELPCISNDEMDLTCSECPLR